MDTSWKGSFGGAVGRKGELAPELCPVCDSEATRWHSIKGYPIDECRRCHHRFVPGVRTIQHVRETFDDSYFSDGGAGYPGYLREGEILRERGHRYARIVARYIPAGRMLDVGCAAGFILRGFLDCGWSGRGLEPNRGMVELGRRSGLDLECGILEDYRSDEQFDLITMLQSMMHFYDLRRACERAADLTRPGGFWLIEAFNPRSLTARLMGKQWHDYNPPSVLHWFSLEVLRLLLAGFGLHQIAGGRAPKSISTAHAKSVLNFKFGGSSGLRRALLSVFSAIPDTLAVPYPGDDIYWALLRKRS